MKHLVLGAGATLAEAPALGNRMEICPPLIRDFARKMWFNYSPHPILELYLAERGYTDVGLDPRKLFFDLEDKGVTNIEEFMDYVWNNRNRTIEKKQVALSSWVYFGWPDYNAKRSESRWNYRS